MADQRALDDIVKNDFPGFIEILEKIMDFKRWGFQQTFSGALTRFPPSLIYDSAYCRVRFMWQIADIRDEHATIYILYGRLHAPNDRETMFWNGEKCWCWHDIRMALHFLDGLSPQEAFESKRIWHPVMEKVRQSEAGEGLEYKRHNLLSAKMHLAVWEYYGQRLFDLLDLRHPNLWEQYHLFQKDLRTIADETYRKKHYRYPQTYGEPASDQIC